MFWNSYSCRWSLMRHAFLNCKKIFANLSLILHSVQVSETVSLYFITSIFCINLATGVNMRVGWKVLSPTVKDCDLQFKKIISFFPQISSDLSTLDHRFSNFSNPFDSQILEDSGNICLWPFQHLYRKAFYRKIFLLSWKLDWRLRRRWNHNRE